MSLFKRKPKMDFTVPHSDGFKGYKRIKLATYKDEYAYKGIKELGAKPISTVGFQIYEDGQNNCVRVFADGHRIGTIWKHSWTSEYNKIKAGKVRAAHVDIVDPDEVHLYICI